MNPDPNNISIRAGILYRSLTRDLTNLSLLGRRHFDALLVTMHQSGTYWLIHQLSYILAKKYNLPVPTDLDELTVITRAKEVPVYRDIPHIAHTHTIPSRLVHCWPNRSLLRFPVTILLVRDLRASLVACYDRYEYDVDFSTYLRGNPWRKRYRKDIWRDFRFLNAWHRVQRRMPGRFHIVRYEDMQRDPQHELLRISSFLEWDISESMIADAVAASTKDKMASKEASTSHLPIVRKRKDHPFAWYTDEDRAFFMEAANRHLHNFFGYDYSNWEIPAIVPIRHEDTSTAGSGSQAM